MSAPETNAAAPAHGGQARTDTTRMEQEPMRDSIHVTMTAQLRRAQVRQRLAALADVTALPAAQIAGRALMLGLGHIEGDLRLIFPAATASTAPTVTSESDTAATAAPPSTTAVKPVPPMTPASYKAPSSTTTTAEELPITPADTAQTPADTTTEPPTTPAATKLEPAPRAEQPDRVTTKDAAAALGKSKGAFSMHLQRHPELRRYSRTVDCAVLWDVAKLRAAWAK